VVGTSDEFKSTSVQKPWTYTNPANDTLAHEGGGSAGYLVLIAFQGVEHDLTTWADRSVRVTQPIAAGDFTVDTSFATELTDESTWQGVVLDVGDRKVRFDVRRANGANTLEASAVSPSGTQALGSRSLGQGSSALILRVQRRGTTLTFSSSTNGQSFTSLGTTTAAQVKTFGPAVGNIRRSNGRVERLVANIDWVRFTR
jgi:hypothetical protein